MEIQGLQTLFKFIDIAENSRKYPPATAKALRSALNKIEPELKDGERASIDRFLENIDAIFDTFFSKNPTKMTAGSVETYKSRIRKVISEYKKYGLSSSDLSNWIPKVGNRKKVLKNISSVENKMNATSDFEQAQLHGVESSISSFRWELPVLQGKDKVVLIIPTNTSVEELAFVRSYIELLEKKIKSK